MASLLFKAVRGSEIKQISRITLKEPNLTFRPPLLLKTSLKKGTILGSYKEGKLVGFIERFDLGKGSYGISTLYVYPDMRGKGLGEKLIKKACDNIDKSIIYTATSNPGLVKVLRKLGFSEISKSEVPLSVSVRWFLLRYYHPRTLIKLLRGNTKGLKLYRRNPLK